MPKKHYNIRITGRVQGVFFRAETRDKAESLGITGFVRNESDGSVYIEAEGEEDKLQQLLEWTKDGPRLAHVENISFEEGEIKDYEEFKVEYRNP